MVNMVNSAAKLRESENRGGLYVHGPYKVAESVLRQLSIVEVQVKELQNAVAEENYCVAILKQISALRSALNKVSQMILKNHLEGCVGESLVDGSLQNKGIVRELMEVISKNEN
jgi:DNA-binding FrmR family transcriptional regulator